jgi:hypothetical protein
MGNFFSLHNCFNNKINRPSSMFGRKKAPAKTVPLIITPLSLDYPIPITYLENGDIQMPQIPGAIAYNYDPPHLIKSVATSSAYETNECNI